MSSADSEKSEDQEITSTSDEETKETQSDSDSDKLEATAEAKDALPAVADGEKEELPVVPADKDQQDTLVGGRREDRSNWVGNVTKTCEYINKISADKSLHFRTSDQLTSKLLICAIATAAVFAILPNFEMVGVAAVSYLLADALLFVAISIFVVNRFGIIRAMQPRHALVTWHLMVGTGLLALVVGFNVIAVVVLVVMRDKLVALFPGG